jgi:hypothetical protein
VFIGGKNSPVSFHFVFSTFRVFVIVSALWLRHAAPAYERPDPTRPPKIFSQDDPFRFALSRFRDRMFSLFLCASMVKIRLLAPFGCGYPALSSSV